MRPIRDRSLVQPHAVLYHSAFGFARVQLVDDEAAILDWEREGENLPERVGFDNLKRVYTVCLPQGFFDLAVNRPEHLKELLQVDPPKSLQMLLEDLNAPQRRGDVHDWIVGRLLMSERAFEQWWKNLRPLVEADARFVVEADTIYLEREAEPDASPMAQLKSANQPPGRRLDLALANREDLDPAFFREQVLLSLRTGGTQVRELAMAALRDVEPDALLQGLLAPGPDNVDALIHVLRRGGWSQDDVSTEVQQTLLSQVLDSIDQGGPLDREGRLAATLIRWGSPGAIEALTEVTDSHDGRRLVRSTITALPPRRGEELGLSMLELALERKLTDSAEWLGSETLACSLVDPYTMAERLDKERPALAAWYRDDYRGVDPVTLADYDDYTEETSLSTAEVYFGDTNDGPIPLADVPPRSGASLIGLGLAMARALAAHHKNGHVCNPSMMTARIRPDDTIEIDAECDPEASPRLSDEDPSVTADVYAAGVLLLQVLLGRPWPQVMPAGQAIPYLNHTVPLIPPAAMAPLDSALHPDPAKRPKDGLQWLAQWQAAVVAEEHRANTRHDARVRLTVGYDTHIGRMKSMHAQTNQDAIFTSSRGPLSLIVCCDGISTANAGSGDIASGIASQIIANLWEQAVPRLAKAGPSETRDFIDRALIMANRAVCEAALRAAGGDLAGRVPMGTTCTVALCHGNRINLSWMGDSRAYLVGPYGASLLTADENQAGERLRAWYLGMTPIWDPVGFALVGYIGHFNEMIRAECLPAHHLHFKLGPSERLVLCSDGVTDYIGDSHPEVAGVLADEIVAESDPNQAARNLVNLANRGGGGDNTSILVATFAE